MDYETAAEQSRISLELAEERRLEQDDDEREMWEEIYFESREG